MAGASRSAGAAPGSPGVVGRWIGHATSPVGWAVFLVTLGVGVVGALSLPAPRPGPVGGPVAAAPGPFLAALVASALAGIVGVVVAIAWERRLGVPANFVVRAAQIVGAMLAVTAVQARLFESFGLGAGLLGTFPLVTVAAASLALASWWVVDGLLRDWRRAALVRDRLAEALDEASGINALLAAAERERFGLQARSISLRLGEPLRQLGATGASLAPTALASELERLVDEVMRPLAHLMHPVAVRTGLIPAIRALGSTYRLTAGPALVAADAAGTLLADEVRLQVYRWVRHLEPAVSGGVVELALRISDDPARPAFVVDARGARAGSRSVDPIGLVAGLRTEGETLRAPLRSGAPATADEAPSSREPRRGLPSWRLLAGRPATSAGFVALISAITTPVRFYPTPVPIGLETIGALAVAGAAPVLVALVLRALPAPRTAAPAAIWSVTAWVLVGVAAGIATWAVATIVAPSTEGSGLLVQLGRGLVRHVPTGIAYQLATGAASRAEADGAALEASLAIAHERRSRLLARAEAIERYASEALHRTAQGRLTAAAALARMDRGEEALREIAQVRDVTLPAIVERLASADLETDDLVEGAAPAGIEVADGVDWSEVGATYPALASPLRRVIDECLVNAQRHGGARRVEIALAVTDGALRLECRDDGTGVAADGPRSAGLGSRLFDEMCGRFGGSWTLGARADGRPGASFTLMVPVQPPTGPERTDEPGRADRSGSGR